MRKHHLILLAVPALALAACGGDDGGGEGAGTAPPTGGGDAITVTASGFEFQPDSLAVPAGESVPVTFTNEDEAAHTFTVEALGVDIAAGAGETSEGELTADAGEYEWFCRIHPTMTGTLTAS